jgi:hypothetical protein
MSSLAVPPSDLSGDDYRRSVESSLASLGQLDDVALHELSRLTAQEVTRLRREIAGAGQTAGLSGFLRHGLMRFQARNVTQERSERSLSAVLRGLNLVPQNLLGAVVAAPTTVALAGYQRMMRLIGRNAEDAFPDGTWQFYLEFNLREDAARHANETVAFQRSLPPGVPEAVQGAAWGAAVARLVLGYDELLALIWQEYASLRLLREIDETLGRRTLAVWGHYRPYTRPVGESYNAYRRRMFRAMLAEHLAGLAPQARQQWAAHYAAWAATCWPTRTR